jgi:ABC-2 type transport system permease protein
MTVEAVAAPVDTTRGVVNIRRATVRAIYVLWKRDMIRYWRSRSRMLLSLAQPLFFLVLLGSGFAAALRGFRGGAGFGGIEYLLFIYPGILCMSVIFSSLITAASVIQERDVGFLREVLAAPIDRSAVAIGKALGGATQATIQGLLVLPLAPFAGVGLNPLAVLEIVGMLFCLSLGLSSLGLALAAAMRSGQTFQMVQGLVMQPLVFLSGALFPIVGLPGWLVVLTRLDLAAYGVDPIRRIVLDASGVPPATANRFALTLFGQPVPIPAEVVLLLAFTALMMAIAVVNFRRKD